MPSLSCEQCEELLPGYVLGILTPEEAAAVAEHVRTCPQCQESLGMYEALVDSLSAAVAQQEPPGDIRQHLQAAVMADLAPLTPTPAARRRWPVRIPRWAMVLTTVNALMLLASLWWAWQAWRDLTLAHEKWQQVLRQLGLQRQALTLLTVPESRRALLQSEKSQARGTLVLETHTSEAVLIVQNLPHLQPDRVYQLWLLRDNMRDNGGVFQVDEQGFGVLLVHAPHPLSAYRAAGITEEPTGGSPGPTTPRVIGGPL